MLYTAEQASNISNHTFAHLLVKEENKTLTITLNRPEKKNALNPVLFRELAFALNYAHYNKNIWTVVIEANGDVFCAGADLKAFRGAEEETISTIPIAEKEVVLGDIFSSKVSKFHGVKGVSKSPLAFLTAFE